MPTHNWSQFVLRIPIRADIDKVYQAWTSAASIESWFLRKSVFRTKDGRLKDPLASIEAGDTYEWYWYGYPDDVVEKDRFLEANGKDRLQFGFGKAGTVTVEIRKEAGETVLQLTQTGIPTDEESQVYYHIGCSRGWLFYLTNLKSILEGGIDLRNRNMELKEVISS